MSTSTPVQQQIIGIDVGADQLQVQLGQELPGRHLEFPSRTSFSNSPKGFNELLQWAHREAADSPPLWFIMEATGTYYEGLAYFLAKRTTNICVLVPHRAKHYAKSLPGESKTDKIDAQILSRYGIERRPRRWEPTSGRLCQIKALLREREQLKKQRNKLSNRRHAACQAWQYPSSGLARMTDHIQKIDEYIEQLQDELDQLWSADQNLVEATERITGIDGLGEQTIRHVVAETNGFALISNRNQLASYSGLDVVLDQSGNRRGATKISKRGNSHIRSALYMPTLSAIQHNKALRAYYQRLLQRHPDRKMMAVTAVMRKLLLLIYSLWKSGQEYDPEFHYQQIIKST